MEGQGTVKDALGDGLFAALLVVILFLLFLLFKEWSLVWALAFGR